AQVQHERAAGARQRRGHVELFYVLRGAGEVADAGVGVLRPGDQLLEARRRRGTPVGREAQVPWTLEVQRIRGTGAHLPGAAARRPEGGVARCPGEEFEFTGAVPGQVHRGRGHLVVAGDEFEGLVLPDDLPLRLAVEEVLDPQALDAVRGRVTEGIVG